MGFEDITFHHYDDIRKIFNRPDVRLPAKDGSVFNQLIGDEKEFKDFVLKFDSLKGFLEAGIIELNEPEEEEDDDGNVEIYNIVSFKQEGYLFSTNSFSSIEEYVWLHKKQIDTYLEEDFNISDEIKYPALVSYCYFCGFDRAGSCDILSIRILSLDDILSGKIFPY